MDGASETYPYLPRLGQSVGMCLFVKEEPPVLVYIILWRDRAPHPKTLHGGTAAKVQWTEMKTV